MKHRILLKLRSLKPGVLPTVIANKDEKGHGPGDSATHKD